MSWVSTLQGVTPSEHAKAWTPNACGPDGAAAKRFFRHVSISRVSQFASALPQFLRFENADRRDDAGDQLRGRDIEAGVAGAAGGIGHANVDALPQLGT